MAEIGGSGSGAARTTTCGSGRTPVLRNSTYSSAGGLSLLPDLEGFLEIPSPGLGGDAPRLGLEGSPLLAFADETLRCIALGEA